MNKQLKYLTRTVFGMFLVLFLAVTVIQFVAADDLNANPLNGRTLKNSYKIERGSILVAGDPIAYSVPTEDDYRFLRQYSEGPLYSAITGYYSRTQGMTGLELALNPELSGTSNSQFFTRIVRTLTGVKPQGNSVETTIDPVAQRAAAEAMAGFEGAVVALEPSTGRVLALYSTPNFDPNLLSTNNDAEIITAYRQLDEDPAQPLQNRAIGGDLYHPGSTYKLITAAAAIENGTATPDSTYPNPAQLPLPQSSAVMQNASRTTCGPGETVTLTEALVLSCNIPFAELAMSMDRDVVPKMARDFGFDAELSIPLVVTPSTSPQPLDSAQAALASIGQLDVRSTPLQMAMVSAGIANDGVLMTPFLVDRVITPDLRVDRQGEPEVFSEPISPETAESLTGMMEGAVSRPDGTAFQAAIPGVRVAGKTGTAENGTDANGVERPYTLWYTGFAPVENPRIALAVVIANGGGDAYQYIGSSYDLPTRVGKQVMEAVLSQ